MDKSVKSRILPHKNSLAKFDFSIFFLSVLWFCSFHNFTHEIMLIAHPSYAMNGA